MADEKTAAVGLSTLKEDILPGIFDNLQILTPKDLLNFRLVNRSWRDASTLVLLKRNACDIVLKLKVVRVAPGIKKKHAPPNFIYCNARRPYSRLPDLISLITTSPKFPSNSITFLPGCEKFFTDLKEFTIQFKDKIINGFVSNLTGLYEIRGLSDQTKIKFSFEAVQMNDQEWEEIQAHLKPVAPFVEISRFGGAIL